MEWFGLIAFVVVMCMPMPVGKGNFRKLENRVRNLENGQKGEKSIMSKLISELVGKKCKIVSTSGMVEISFSGTEQIFTVLDTDEDWVKVQYEDKKKNTITKLIRISDIVSVDIVE